ncbi:hypothetical protein NQ315_006831 [Exocentrus adspersus]|uniref:Uncharacterized protein n=1 Tax=Exocentrus adspersus TaxID=1586481 RepID=A0AAV8WBU9_9CUCU|nr:hypothetical protein NQ315_006831 [Exocentrus adspersus]
MLTCEPDILTYTLASRQHTCYPNGSSDMNNQRRQLRRKSSGRLTEGGRIVQNNKPKDPKDIEEKSAVKIQASVRGFLVRRRQKKQKNSESDRT